MRFQRRELLRILSFTFGSSFTLSRKQLGIAAQTALASLLAICPDLCVSFEDKGGSFQAACTAAPLASAINSSTDHWS
jgi:hypothetical protein